MEAQQTKKFYKHKIANLISVRKIVTVHYQRLVKGYRSEEERHDFWEIIYADKGEIFIVTPAGKRLLKKGELCFLQPNLPHYVACEQSEPNIFIVSFECRSESMRYFAEKILPAPESCRALLQTVMSEAMQTFHIPDFDPALNKLELLERPNLGGEQVIENSLELLLIYLLRRENEQNAAQTFFVSKIETSADLQDEIVRYLSACIYKKFSLEELCNRLHYGKTYLCTRFKQATGKSIYGVYLHLKTDEAKKLIRKGVPFADVADKLRFHSLPHFIAVFKKHTGMTPKEYRSSIHA